MWCLCQSDRLNRDVDDAAVGHGIAGVGYEIDDDLFQLPGIDLDRHDLIGRNNIEPNVFSNQPVQELFEINQQGIEIDDSLMDSLFPREGQQLTDQGRRPRCGLLNLVDPGEKVAPIFEARLQEIARDR